MLIYLSFSSNETAGLGFREMTDGTSPWAKTLVPECLDHVSITNIRRYFCHCYQYMDAYRSVWMGSGVSID